MSVRDATRATAAPPESDGRPTLVTGGAGFIGANLAHRLAQLGRRVLIFDNLSRPGVARNLAWLRATHGERIAVTVADIRDAAAVREAVRSAGAIFHLAAQVAVTTSLTDPATDFAINAGGTLNLLEALRQCERPAPLLLTSTNKVYGAIKDLPLLAGERRYEIRGATARGIDEERPLDFHSPYGCSKGTADQYVLDYARSFGLPAAVFRMSCIYGPRQCGTEDQGWVAHFLLSALRREPITIYGDGRQVRDILYVDDLVDALLLARRHIDSLRGEAFNIGGGAANTTSLRELLDRITELHGHALPTLHSGWRVGDQLYYVSDHGKFTRATGWQPQVSAADGIARLYRWLRDDLAETALLATVPNPAQRPARRAVALRQAGTGAAS